MLIANSDQTDKFSHFGHFFERKNLRLGVKGNPGRIANVQLTQNQNFRLIKAQIICRVQTLHHPATPVYSYPHVSLSSFSSGFLLQVLQPIHIQHLFLDSGMNFTLNSEQNSLEHSSNNYLLSLSLAIMAVTAIVYLFHFI